MLHIQTLVKDNQPIIVVDVVTGFYYLPVTKITTYNLYNPHINQVSFF